MKKILLSLFAVLMTVGAWAQITSLSDLANTSSYTIKCVNRGFLYYDSTNGDYVTSSSHTDLVDATPTGAANELFAFLRTNKTAEGNYYLFSKSANKFVTYKGTGVALELTDDPKHAWTVAASDGYFTIKVPETQQTYINITNWQAKFGCKVTSTAPDDGNKMTIKEVGTSEDFTAAIAKITTFETVVTLSYTITDNAGNVYEGTFEAAPETDPTFTGVAGYTLSDKKWDGNKLTATINFPFPVSKVAGVTNTTMIHQGSWNTEKRWHAVGDEVKIQTQDVDPENISEWLWAIYPQFADGAFSFKIKNVSADKYVSVNLASEADVTANNKPVTLGTEGTAFTVSASGSYIKFNYVNTAGTSLHFSINSSKDTDVFLGVYGGSHDGDKIGFPAYSVVTISNIGYSTIYLPFDAALCEGLEAYAVTATSATKATLTALQGIKANQGAILKGAASTEYVLAAGNVSSDWSGNLLRGSVEDAYVEGDAYVLSNKNGIGLYKADLNKDAAGEAGTTHFLNNAGKAYLPASEVTGNARFISFDFGTETAIESVESVENNAAVYDLSGRRVQKAQKGLYIVNGKVVLK